MKILASMDGGWRGLGNEIGYYQKEKISTIAIKCKFNMQSSNVNTACSDIRLNAIILI
jgi:hypothetical protein